MYFMMFYDVICLRNAYKCVEKESKLQSEVNILVCFTRLYDVTSKPMQCFLLRCLRKPENVPKIPNLQKQFRFFNRTLAEIVTINMIYKSLKSVKK